jgi:hypothetical protein
MSDTQQAAPASEPTAMDVLNARLSEPDTANTTVPDQVAAAPVAPQAPVEPVEAARPGEEAGKLLDPAASKFAALSRKEREIRQREQKFKSESAAMEQRIKALEAREQEFEQAWKQNPLEAMKKRGIDYKELTEKYVLHEEPTAEQKQMEYIKSLEAKFDALESQLKQKEESTKKQQEELQAKSAEQAKTNYINHLTEFVNKNNDKYEMIAKNDAVNLIYEVMETHYENTKDPETGEGKLLTEEQAADEVENYLFSEAKKLIESNKIKNLFAPKAEATIEPKKSSQSATLSNTLSQQAPIVSEEYLSDDESKRRVAALLKWND